jgi:multidrug efflux pump subunit AcrA (membrane-fusion protein)
MRWLAAVLCGIGLASWLLMPGPRERAAAVREEPVSVVLAPAGGEVLEVLVRPGDRVEAGQVLLRAKVKYGREATAPLQDAMVRLQRLPDAVWKQAEQSDPERLKADKEYVARLAEWDKSGSSEAKRRLEQAVVAREAAYRKASPFSKEAFRQWQQQIGNYEVLSTAAGRVEILDWKTGDELPVMARVALIAR